MPPSITHSSGGKLRRNLAIVVLALAIAGGYGFTHLGTFLAREDPLKKADAIFVLAGTEFTRSLEGGDLYLEGYAPRVVLSREALEPAFAVIARRGAKVSSSVERARDLLLQLGIPPTALLLPNKLHTSTADEAITLRELATTNHWRTIIIVSSKMHLRRAHFAFTRELRGTGVQLVMRGSRYDNSTPSRWWRQRGDMREIWSETAKLVAYLAGLGA